MIKNWNQFNESNHPPKIEESGAASIHLSKNEVEFFSDEPQLTNLISKHKITLNGDKLVFRKDDVKTIEILSSFFPKIDEVL